MRETLRALTIGFKHRQTTMLDFPDRKSYNLQGSSKNGNAVNTPMGQHAHLGLQKWARRKSTVTVLGQAQDRIHKYTFVVTEIYVSSILYTDMLQSGFTITGNLHKAKKCIKWFEWPKYNTTVWTVHTSSYINNGKTSGKLEQPLLQLHVLL